MAEKKRTLDETTHILHLYGKHVGNSEVPLDLHLWSCISGVAACMADRVWLEKFRGKKLLPSLYTFLIAPSGRGKGIACDTITDYLGDLPRMNIFAGATTAERLMEMMSNTRKKAPSDDSTDRGKVYLVMEELALCIGAGPAASAFIKLMTGFYKRDAKLAWRKETVAGATASIGKPCINWLAGTTKEWLTDAIPPEAIEGGFAGRIAACYIGGRTADKRVFRPTVPHDYDEIRDHLAMRFERLTQVEGAFSVSSRALRLEEHWYNHRPPPTDERLFPTWQRQHDLLLKLGMILSLCESEDLVIRRHHLAAAQKLASASYKAVQYLLVSASASPETKKLDKVRALIKDARSLQMPTLVRMAASRGITRWDLVQCIESLKAGREVETVRVGRRSVVAWRTGAPRGRRQSRE